MRLHRLTMRAFGPFAGVEEIDFDELCDAGLFLLTGPTGAGKTTILDAVCFALYGSVPGVRGVKALKSQHAADDVAPEVVLDFSVRDRRFLVRRTPEWTRPKRRGTGLVTEKAAATIVETTRGEDQLWSSRAQEVGHFVSELVGMQSSQFVQVAMLPQGGFEKFLRASSQDRHDVLQHLFRTSRFARIEEWVHDHSRSLKGRATDGQAAVQRLVHTLADRAGADLPEELAADDWPGQDVPDRAHAWARALVASADEKREEAEQVHARAAAAAGAAREVHAETSRRVRAWERRVEAEALHASLAEGEAEADRLRQRLDADARASRCLPLLEVLTRAAADRRRTGAERDTALQRLATAGTPTLTRDGSVAITDLEKVEQTLRTRITRIEALLPREATLQQGRGDLARTERLLAEARRSLEDATRRRDALPGEIAEVTDQLTTVGELAATAPGRVTELEAARTRLGAAEAVETCAADLTRLRDLHRDARDRAADAREHVQSMMARRLAGIAAELAGRLVDGAACQVCGSPDHPAPARAGADAVSPAEQEAAAAAHDELAAAHDEALRAVNTAERRRDLLAQTAAGRTVEQARAEVEVAEAVLAEARAAEAARVSLVESRNRLETELGSLAEAVHARDTEVTALVQQAHAHRGTIALAEADLAALSSETAPEGWAGSWSEALEGLRRVLAHVVHARVAVAAANDAVARYAQAEKQAVATAGDQEFADLEQVRQAALDETDRAVAVRTLEKRHEAFARVSAVLSDPDVQAGTVEPPPDPAPSFAALSAAETALAEAFGELHHRKDCVASLRTNLGRLETAVTEWAPARRSYVRAENMSRLVRGVGGDNQLQMRLSAYVLATRLDQVVAAANERLGHMRDQRYLLQRTGRATRKGSQAGLGLEVVDQWTGDVREPATLSGGETFVVSLALALGLADVVTQEAGGTEIETLFVDEGFGTLDADTLDDVMDRLDDLRAGGRAVGVVSHVSELRNRIPTQLHVDKHRTGSRVSVRTLAG